MNASCQLVGQLSRRPTLQLGHSFPTLMSCLVKPKADSTVSTRPGGRFVVFFMLDMRPWNSIRDRSRLGVGSLLMGGFA